LKQCPTEVHMDKKGHSVRRIVVMALSVIMALVVAIPVASGQETRNLADLTADWWNWASSMNPSPTEGSYTNTAQCEGEYVDGVFFLAGSAFGENKVERTCTVPADTPIFFPIVNVICSEAFGVAGQDPPDPEPYDTACVEPATDDVIDPPSKWYATLDKQDLEQQRIASGLFDWTIVFPNNPFPGFVPGTYESASDGLWVYLEEGLPAGEHTIVFGGKFKDTPFGHFKGTRVTYHLTAE
jgi:hypothetical protein